MAKPKTKITQELRDAVIALHLKNSDLTQVQLGEAFNISRSTAAKICDNYWTDIMG